MVAPLLDQFHPELGCHLLGPAHPHLLARLPQLSFQLPNPLPVVRHGHAVAGLFEFKFQLPDLGAHLSLQPRKRPDPTEVEPAGRGRGQDAALEGASCPNQSYHVKRNRIGCSAHSPFTPRSAYCRERLAVPPLRWDTCLRLGLGGLGLKRSAPIKPGEPGRATFCDERAEPPTRRASISARLDRFDVVHATCVPLVSKRDTSRPRQRRSPIFLAVHGF